MHGFDIAETNLVTKEIKMKAQKKSDKRKTILWAMDPSQDPKCEQAIVKELKTWAKKLDCDIQPVSILSDFPKTGPLDFTITAQFTLESAAARQASSFLKTARAAEFLSPKIIFVPWKSTRRMADALTEYAAQEKAIAIFTNIRSKKIWSSFRLGGFAESLITSSTVPVLVLNPKSSLTSKSPNVLFPTDFGVQSQSALMHFTPWAKAFDAKVLVYNQVENLANYSYAFSIPSSAIDVKELNSKSERARIKEGNIWTHHLQSHGVESKEIIQNQKKSLAADILATAKKNKVGLIVMASNSGPISQVLMGSVAKDILLQANCPVLIYYRPHSSKKSTRKWKEPVLPKKVSHLKSALIAADLN
jgi:nucleotide-binding universal stress UspA family protein